MFTVKISSRFSSSSYPIIRESLLSHHRVNLSLDIDDMHRLFFQWTSWRRRRRKSNEGESHTFFSTSRTDRLTLISSFDFHLREVRSIDTSSLELDLFRNTERNIAPIISIPNSNWNPIRLDLRGREEQFLSRSMNTVVQSDDSLHRLQRSLSMSLHWKEDL